MSDVNVRASLAAELPGGLPACHLREYTARFSDGPVRRWGVFEGNELVGMHEAVLPLPGPDNLNSAGLLVRLAGVVGLELEPGEVPRLYWDHMGRYHLRAGADARERLVPLPLPGWDRCADPTFQARSRRLRQSVEWLGLLFGVARMAGVEVPAGVVPEWRFEAAPDGDCWALWVGGECAYSYQWAPATAGDDPALSLRAVYEHMRGGRRHPILDMSYEELAEHVGDTPSGMLAVPGGMEEGGGDE